jgi:Putative metal-binding motif
MRVWWLIVGANLLLACGGGKDSDKDGFGADVDCDDEDEAVFPGAAEACDGVDNDCDGESDNIAGGAGSVFYADADGDGFGDPVAEVEACEAPAGFVADGTDCDDGSGAAFPGGDELCDGLDNDCDDTTPDEGVAFEASDGSWTDLTLVFSAGSPSAPFEFPLTEDGVLHLCAGDWYVSLPASANVSIRGEAGPDLTTLDGADVAPLVVVDGPYTVDVSGLTLANAGPTALSLPYPYEDLAIFGGGLACSGAATVSGTDLVFLGGAPSADLYSGSLVTAFAGCTLDVSDSQLLGGVGELGGQVYVDRADAHFTNTSFLAGGADAGGAILTGDYLTALLGLDPAPTTVTCDECEFVSNSAGLASAVIVLGPAVFTMHGGSFRNNTSPYDGAALVVYPNLLDFYGDDGTAVLDGVYFSGNTAGGYPADVQAYASGTTYDFSGTTQSATCDSVGCL